MPLVGAGLSRQATIKEGSKSLPTWAELIEELASFATDIGGLQPDEGKEIIRLVRNGKYLMATQALKDVIPEHEFELYMLKRFNSKGVEPGPIHRTLFKLKPSIVMTTNYDLLLENAYLQRFGNLPNVATPTYYQSVVRNLKAPRYSDSYRPVIFKIHGTAREVSTIVLSEMDYRRVIYTIPHYRSILSTIFMAKTVLMLGFSLSDLNVITVLLETLRGAPDYVVLHREEKRRIERERLRRDFGIEVIEYQDHQDLLGFVERLSSFVPVTSDDVN